MRKDVDFTVSCGYVKCLVGFTLDGRLYATQLSPGGRTITSADIR